MVSRSVRSCGGQVKYTTMHHSILPCRSVLQVLLRSVSSIPPSLGSYGTSISRYPSVSRYARTCEIRWDQVQSYSPALRGALRSGAYGSVLQAAGEEVKASYQPWVSYGTSISRYQRVSGSVRS